MTFNELHKACEIELDKHESPWFDTTEKDYFLNNAQEIIVDLIHEQFELNEQARKDAVSLVEVVSFLASSFSQGVDRFYYNRSSGSDYPGVTDCRYILRVNALYNICGEDQWRPVKPIRWDEWDIVRNNSYYRPTDIHPVYLEYSVSGDYLIELKDETSPKELSVTYMRKPKEINALSSPNDTPDLVDRVQKHLVDIAVDLMLENIESKRQQTHYSKFRKYLSYERESIHTEQG